MLWFLLSLVTALMFSYGSIVRKHLSKKYIFTVSFVNAFFSLSLLLPLTAIYGIAISFSALPYLIIAGAFAIAGSVLLYYSFRIGEVSSTVPMLNLTPIFMLPFSFIFLGEVPGVVNLLGILLVCTGGFLIGRFSRVRKASIIAVLVAVLWACAGVFHKKALLSMNMLSFVFLSFFIKSAVLSLPSAIEVKRYGVELRDLKYLLISAVTTLIALSCNYYAYILTQAVYVITVKRLSALFSVILAGKMLSELAIKEKLAGASLMVAGCVLLVI